VLGGGLTGTTVALALARAGKCVLLRTGSRRAEPREPAQRGQDPSRPRLRRRSAARHRGLPLASRELAERYEGPREAHNGAVLRHACRAGRDGNRRFSTVKRASRPKVVACVPAWNAATFIGPVLDSIAAQTYANLDVLISVDACADGTAELCEAFAATHPNVAVIRQPSHLGWVGNCTALIGAVEGITCSSPCTTTRCSLIKCDCSSMRSRLIHAPSSLFPTCTPIVASSRTTSSPMSPTHASGATPATAFRRMVVSVSRRREGAGVRSASAARAGIGAESTPRIGRGCSRSLCKGSSFASPSRWSARSGAPMDSMRN
jgi:glycosyl transferase family 2